MKCFVWIFLLIALTSHAEEFSKLVDTAIKDVVSAIQTNPNERRKIAEEWIQRLYAAAKTEPERTKAAEVEDLFKRIGALTSNRPKTTVEGFSSIFTGEFVISPVIESSAAIPGKAMTSFDKALSNVVPKMLAGELRARLYRNQLMPDLGYGYRLYQRIWIWN